MTEPISLVPRFTQDAAQAFWAVFEPRDTLQELTLDCSAVRHLSSAGLQVLLMAQARAKHAGAGFHLKNPSEDFLAGLSRLGATDLFSGDIA